LSGTIQISLGLYIYTELHKLTILWIAFDFVLAWALLVPNRDNGEETKRVRI
jgi:hypothetical protein